MAPEYTYRDYAKLIGIVAEKSLVSKVYSTLFSTLSHYVFGGQKDYKTFSNEDLIDTIPINHEMLSMLMQQPYKKMIYERPFEDLPTEMGNSYKWADDIIKWRFDVGK